MKNANDTLNKNAAADCPQCDIPCSVPEQVQHRSSTAASRYGTYARRIPRTGWVNFGIPEPETVAEHTLRMWLIGTLFLPDTCPGLPGYSKPDVLSTILIHDLGEAVTGDIITPVKDRNPEYYDDLEQQAMEGLFLPEPLPGRPDQQQNIALWNAWRDGSTVNARIAKEIDKIQMIDQALRYALAYPRQMTDDRLSEMLGAVKIISTRPGREIYRSLIQDNAQFRPLLQRLGLADTLPDRL